MRLVNDQSSRVLGSWVVGCGVHENASENKNNLTNSPLLLCNKGVNLVLGADFDIYLVQVSDWLTPKHSAVTIRG